MLTPRETEKLLIDHVAELARRRRQRGLKLNFPESIALFTEALRTDSPWRVPIAPPVPATA